MNTAVIRLREYKYLRDDLTENREQFLLRDGIETGLNIDLDEIELGPEEY